MKKLIFIFLIIILDLVLIDKIKIDDEYIIYEVGEDIISKQESMDNYIIDSLNNNYTIDNPLIITNPYLLNPLSAFIIFSSNNTISVEIYLNDEYVNTMEDTKFIIPIIYLIEDYNNKITLKYNNITYDYYIKTDKVISDDVNINGSLDGDYLYSSTFIINHFILNKDNQTIWYLDINSNSFIESIDDNTFLIGVEEMESVDNISYYSGIYKMDYMGKIIARYDTTYKYHHAIKYIGNNKVLILGESGSIHLNTLYELDLDTGEIVKNINIDEMLINNNSNIESYLNSLEYGLNINSIDYLDGLILLSIRNINTIICFDYNTLDIKYIISSNKYIRKYFKYYLLNIDFNILGMHDARFIDENNISFYNNGYDYTKEYNNQAAAGIILNISTLKYKKYSIDGTSYAYGSFNSKTSLINYAYIIDGDNTISKIVSLNDKSSITFNIPIYKVEKYSKIKLNNYSVKNYTYYNTLEVDKISIPALKLNNIFTITKNTITSNLSTSSYDKLTIYFVGKKTYEIDYLNTTTYFKVDKDKYKIIICMDGVYYNLYTIVDFT